jgi:hypothetical protein
MQQLLDMRKLTQAPFDVGQVDLRAGSSINAIAQIGLTITLGIVHLECPLKMHLRRAELSCVRDVRPK